MVEPNRVEESPEPQASEEAPPTAETKTVTAAEPQGEPGPAEPASAAPRPRRIIDMRRPREAGAAPSQPPPASSSASPAGSESAARAPASAAEPGARSIVRSHGGRVVRRSASTRVVEGPAAEPTSAAGPRESPPASSPREPTRAATPDFTRPPASGPERATESVPRRADQDRGHAGRPMSRPAYDRPRAPGRPPASFKSYGPDRDHGQRPPRRGPEEPVQAFRRQGPPESERASVTSSTIQPEPAKRAPAPAPKPRPPEAPPAPKAEAAPAQPVAPPTPPPEAPAPLWLPPAREGQKRKKKPALTPKEALRAKVQARSTKQPPRAQPSSEADEADRSDAASPEPSTPSRPEAPRADTKPKRAAARKAPPPAEPEDEASAEPPAKPGLLARILGVFRKR